MGEHTPLSSFLNSIMNYVTVEAKCTRVMGWTRVSSTEGQGASYTAEHFTRGENQSQEIGDALVESVFTQ